jgi:GT2 family glycosyltransferase
VRFIAETGTPASVASLNRVASEARGDVLVFFHRAAIPLDGWLPPLVDAMRMHPTVGAVGAKVLAVDGRLEQAGGVVFADATTRGFGSEDYLVDDPLYAYVREVDFSSDVLHAISRSLFEELGGFDSSYGSATLACADFCFRARTQGYSVLYQPASVAVTFDAPAKSIVTLESCNGGASDRGLFKKKWGHILQHQPTPRHWRDRDTWLSLAAIGGRVPEESK